ncbi:hypothetical protein CBS9595_003240 [Malassezia furfur]|nr:hypothetical protein CBS9595_003240 [Malassezia furfur]
MSSSGVPRRGRWAATRRRASQSKSAAPTSKLHQSVLSNDALETRIQNEMSPFPPTFTENVSRRDVPRPVEEGLPSLRDVALRIAGQHFSTHILPTPEVFERLQGTLRSAPKTTRKRRKMDDDYTPEDDEEQERPVARPPSVTMTYTQALYWSETNRDLLKHLPPVQVDALFDAICLYSPWSLTKEVFSTYFLPHVAPEKTRLGGVQGEVPPLPLDARVRTRIFFPASLPLFSQDHKTASLLLSVLAGALALSPSAARLTSVIRDLDLHGLTRLQNASLVRLLRAPPSAPNAQPTPWHLRHVALPGCTAIGDAAITALVRATGATLEELDLAMTSVSTSSVREIGAACPHLRSLRVAWCENFAEDTFSEAVSVAVAQCANAKPPRIPFQQLVTVDVSHTSVGDLAIGGLLRLCGSQLRSLDVGYTNVGGGGSLDMLRLGLGLPNTSAAHPSPLGHLGLGGLCVHSASLLDLVEHLLSEQGSLTSLDLDDLVEYARRHQSNLQGRTGVSGATLHRLAEAIANAVRRRQEPFTRFLARGDKRRASVPGHWAVPGAARSATTLGAATLGATVFRLLTTCRFLALNGLQLDAYDLDEQRGAPSTVHTLHLGGTGLRDDALDALVPWTGALESLYLDDTLVTSSALDRLVHHNPYLVLISLSQCRGIPVRERRSYFQACSERAE